MCILLALAVAASAVCLGVTFIGKDYEKADDTAYKILQITDVHILNDEKKDAKASDHMRAVRGERHYYRC